MAAPPGQTESPAQGTPQNKLEAPPELPSLSEYLATSGMPLLRLRESLEAEPQRTGAACEQWWSTQAAQASQPDKERVLSLWGQVDPAGCAKAVGQTLQKAWRALPKDAYLDCEDNQHYRGRLCQLLGRLGPDAAQPFLDLASDPLLPISARASALEQLAKVAPPQWLPDIAFKGLADPSDPQLREPLERALLRRTRQDRPAKTSLTQGLQTRLTQGSADPVLALRLWNLLGQISGTLDATLYRSLGNRVLDIKTSVPQRVVFARILSKTPESQAVLMKALTVLYKRIEGPGPDSIVLTQALQAISPKARATFLDTHPTWLSSAPHLAEQSWLYAALPQSPSLRASLLRTGLYSIWPQIQSAALSRLEAPCSPANQRKAIRMAGPQSQGGSPERSVRRAAIDALGRCPTRRTLRALRRLADNEAVGAYDRGRALRRYVEQTRKDKRSADRVRTIIRRAPNELGRSALFLGLGQLQDPPAYILEELCLWANSSQPLVVRTSAPKAKDALRSLGHLDACKEPQ